MAVIPGSVGILPPGALGVSFFYHLTRQLSALNARVFLLERQNSASAKALHERGKLLVAVEDEIHHLSTQTVLRPDLLSCERAGTLPEVLLVCTNPDQLFGVITTLVELLVQVHGRGELMAGEPILPLIVLCSNGIYFQRIRQLFIEKLEEATLFGQLPDLWPSPMTQIVGRLLRGVTLQTGLREGSGPQTIYRPGPPGLTRIAGGDTASRERCQVVLTEQGAWFEVSSDSPTRIEFNKAQVNLACNLLGQLYAIDETGRFKPLTVGEIFLPERIPQIRELSWQVFQVGKAVKAYQSTEDFESVFAQLQRSCGLHQTHVPSSLQWVGMMLASGQLEARLPPTETWLLEPLLYYARAAGLEDTVRYLEGLKEALLKKLDAATQRPLTRT